MKSNPDANKGVSAREQERAINWLSSDLNLPRRQVIDLINKRLKQTQKSYEKFIKEINLFADISQVIGEYIQTLAKKYRQKVFKDDYGNLVYDDFVVELNYFIRNVVDRDVPRRQKEAKLGVKEEGDEAIRDEIITRLEKTPDMQISSHKRLDNNPLEFEYSCMRILENRGWEVQHTGKSGDQGADLIATKAQRIVVVQCKTYGKAVGNSAVQEVNAARSYVEANEAAVVTNSSYTRDAKKLANQTGVQLLHVNDLYSL